jgi:queuosine precursor transporter
LPGKWLFNEFLVNASWSYAFKLLVNLALIPMIYLGHYVIGKYLKGTTNDVNNLILTRKSTILIDFLVN